MRVVFWDTRKRNTGKPRIHKYENHGFGAAESWLPDRLLRPWRRKRRPVSLLFAYLAAIFHQHRYHVQYVTDRMPPQADVYIFNPALATLPDEQLMIEAIAQTYPSARIFVVGQLPTTMPDRFAELPVSIIKGDAEQLLWTFDDVLNRPRATVNLGQLDDLNHLPPCDWSPFMPWRFQIRDQCWQYPTALIEHGRGCPDSYGNYSPGTNSTTRFESNLPNHDVRFRDAKRVADEIQYQINTWGFYAFGFCDPCFGHDPDQTYELIGQMGEIWQDFQFSIQSRIDFMTPSLIRALCQVGLRSITVEFPAAPPMASDQLNAESSNCKSIDASLPVLGSELAFFQLCHKLGLRTTAIFSVGMPHQSDDAFTAMVARAKRLNPTFAKFRFVTPLPESELLRTHGHLVDQFQFSQYTTLSPIFPMQSSRSVRQLEKRLARCYREYYLRREYFARHGSLLWPNLARWAMETDVTSDGSESRSEETSPSTPKRHFEPGHFVPLDNNRYIRHDEPHDQPSTLDTAKEHHDVDDDRLSF